MGIGNLLLNWGVLVVGLVLFGFGCLWISFYNKAYKMHVLHYGRVSIGKEYGTTWTKEDTKGVTLMISIWVIGALGIPGALLFFFTSLPEIGMPLWAGCTLGIAGILLFIIASVSSAGLAKREVEIAWRHKQEQEKLDSNNINE